MQAGLVYWDKMVPTTNIEEFYILVDLLARLGSGLGQDSGDEQMSENARYMIAKTLEVEMGTEISRTHSEFLSKVIARGDGDSTVISLNWGIAYDGAVTAEFGLHALDDGYENARATAKPSTTPDWAASFRLYKLHGSSNWMYCPSRQTLWYVAQKGEVVGFWEGDEDSSPSFRLCKDLLHCRGTMQPLMIPPSSQKFESGDVSVPLAAIWRKARKALTSCREIVFVGYSFPPTDVQFKMLVVEALTRNTSLSTLGVVTAPKFGAERTAFEDHWSAVFSDPRLKHKLKFKYATFEDWVTKDGGSLLETAKYD